MMLKKTIINRDQPADLKLQTNPCACSTFNDKTTTATATSKQNKIQCMDYISHKNYLHLYIRNIFNNNKENETKQKKNEHKI